MAMEKLDPRLNAFRPDLADERLRGRVESTSFVPGILCQVMQPVAPMRRMPGADKELLNEALIGERARVFDWGAEAHHGWAWVQLERDGYVGYMPAQALSSEVTEPTHRVTAAGTWVYAAADIKSAAVLHLSLGAEIAVRRLDERFAELASGYFVVARHIMERGRFARDFVEVAERFIGTPYLWGGRTRLGLDCSSLVQLALEATGQACPRDSDMQQAALGASVLVPDDLEGLDRGDLVFWPRHVGIMTDGVMLLHANAHHMSVAAEPLANAVARNRRAGLSISAVKRIARGPAPV
jgi:cell wall-associated NlpC family hydrolase